MKRKPFRLAEKILLKRGFVARRCLTRTGATNASGVLDGDPERFGHSQPRHLVQDFRPRVALRPLEGHDLPGAATENRPQPLLVGFIADKTPRHVQLKYVFIPCQPERVGQRLQLTPFF